MSNLANTSLGARLISALDQQDERAISESLSLLKQRAQTSRLAPALLVGTIAELQRRKRFRDLIHVAESAIDSAGSRGIAVAPAELLRRYSQALIEQGALTAAETMLAELATRLDDEAAPPQLLAQANEIRGLQGRVAKQRYMNSGGEHHLSAAINRYQQAYQTSRKLATDEDRDAAVWHGGNLLALLHRAQRDGVEVEHETFAVQDLYGELDTLIGDDDDALDVFWLGTRIELLVADGTPEAITRATEIASGIAATGHATAFEITSMVRQLREVWQRGFDDPIVQALHDAMLTMSGPSSLTLKSDDELESLLFKERPIAHRNLAQLVQTSHFVCMVTDDVGSPIGSGFLVPGSALSREWPDDLVLVTNHHVTTTQPDKPETIPPAEARARFELVIEGGSPVEVTDLKELWTSAELDVTVLALEVPEALSELKPLAVSNTPPRLDTADPYVFVIGHPLGQPLSVSIRGNELIDATEMHLHYYAPTEHGSSGSPVLGRNLRLIGLHHRGGFRMPSLSDPEVRIPANEAITISAIKKALVEHHSAHPPADSPPNEPSTTSQGTAQPTAHALPYDDLLEAFPKEVEAELIRVQQLRHELAVKSDGLEFLVDHQTRWPVGSTVRVGFLGGDPALHAKIAEAVGEIDQTCNLTLDFGHDPATDTYRTWSTTDVDYQAEIRVSFDLPGYFSLVGTDSVEPTTLSADLPVGGRPGQRSLNFGGFDAALPAAWKRTVLHEFLHALAFAHEHQNSRGTCQQEFRWDDDAGYETTRDAGGRFIPDNAGRRPGVYTYLSGEPNNWPRERVDHNLRSDPGNYAAGPFDPESVMLYRFAPLFYESDPSPCAPTTEGSSLSEGDRLGLQLLYPDVADPSLTARARRAEQALHQLGALDEAMPSIDLRDRVLNGLQARLDRYLATTIDAA